MGANTVEINDANFEAEVEKSATPVLIDFWAAWCAPCRALAPTVDAIAEEYKGRVKVGKLDVDANQSTATRFNIRGIPTLLVVKDGQVKEQIVGAVDKSVIVKALDKHLYVIFAAFTTPIPHQARGRENPPLYPRQHLHRRERNITRA